MDLFNKKKLADMERQRNYYIQICETQTESINMLNATVDNLNNQLKLISKDGALNKLFDENAKLIEWIQKILEACNTQYIDEPYKSITIPIYKQVKAYHAAQDWRDCPQTKTDIYIPAIHISEVR